MWFEILPSMGIITACVAGPHFIGYALCQLTLGKIYRRSVNDELEIYHYQRDKRLTGNPHVLQGLEAIPDE